MLRGDPPPRFSTWSVNFELGANGDAGSDPQAVEAALGLDRATRRQLQLGLQAAGFDPGLADGLFGPRTRAAIRSWQASRDAPASGYLNRTEVEALLGGVRPSAFEVPATASPAPNAAQENLFWQSIMESKDSADFEAYLRQYPNGAFRALAQNRLAGLAAPAGPVRPCAAGRPTGSSRS